MSKKGEISSPVKVLLFWYIFIYISTEILSLVHLLTRESVFSLNLFFWLSVIYLFRKKIKKFSFSDIRYRVPKIIPLILILTFIQGIFSAPSTTDSMVYHIPRIIYWIQDQTIQQNVIRNAHDFMPPFAEFILLHLYLIFKDDRFLFFSQWIAYAFTIYLSWLISLKIGLKGTVLKYTLIAVATLPIAVLQASSTQTDMVTAVFIMLSVYLVFCLSEKLSFENLFLFGVVLGLGSLVKSSFYIFSVIPLGLLSILLVKNRPKINILLISISFFVALIIQIPFFTQNLYLYGSLFGTRLVEQNSVYSNDQIGLNVTFSNVIRNIFIQIPFPLINSYLEYIIINFHKLLNLDINDTRTTFENSAFHVQKIIFPQEDIAGNPLHLILIFFSGMYLIKYFRKEKYKASVLYILSFISFFLFSSVFKWQRQHPRLEMPFLLIATISSLRVLDIQVIESKLFKIFLFFSSFLAITFILFNISHPYISYSYIYKYVKGFSQPMSSVPEAFYIETLTDQYFNSRYYWKEPYKKVINNLSAERHYKIYLNLKDGFEYPLIILLNNASVNYRLVAKDEINNETVIISTTENANYIKGYVSKCYETPVEYGFACIYFNK